MSWDSYVDVMKMQANAGDGFEGGLYGLDGAPWTTFNILPSEAASLLGSALTTKDFSQLQAGGLAVFGQQFEFSSTDGERSITFVNTNTSQKISAHSSITAYAICKYPSTLPEGNAQKGVAYVAEYLEAMNM